MSDGDVMTICNRAAEGSCNSKRCTYYSPTMSGMLGLKGTCPESGIPINVEIIRADLSDPNSAFIMRKKNGHS